MARVWWARRRPAAPPDPAGATQPVREQNLDTAGWIAVHEQGTADVNVTNTTLPVTVQNSSVPVTGTVAVSNLPPSLDVNVTNKRLTVAPAPATRAERFHFDVSDQELHSFDPPINASTIEIHAYNEEVFLHFYSPLVGGSDQRLLFVGGNDRNITEQMMNLTQPVPISAVWILCQNDFEDCDGWISVIGN